MSGLEKDFLAARDLRIFKARQQGVAVAQIAAKFEMTTSAVTAAVNRQLTRMSQEALLAYPEMLAMELARYDELMAALWPMTQKRQVTMDDGTTVTYDPDPKVTAEVRALMSAKQKLLGMDVNRQEVLVTGGAEVRSNLHGKEQDSVDQHDPKEEVMKLLEIMGDTGVLPEANKIRNELMSGDIVDAELVEDDPEVEPDGDVLEDAEDFPLTDED